MPWSRWKSPTARPESSSRAAIAVAPLLLVLALLAGCATAPQPPVPAQRVSADDWRYVLPPLSGYPLTVAPGVGQALAAAAAGLADSSAWPEVEASAERLLEDDPGLHPAQLLLAQVAFVERDYARVLELVRPITDELPEYDAALLLLGRAADKLERVPLAYEAFRAGAPRLNLAAARATQLRERALEIVGNRVADALARGRLEEAEANLERLEEWAPGEPPTLRAARGVAVAAGDLERELAVVASLAELEAGDRELQERRAELELEVGEPSTGLRILQQLAARHPDDAGLADKLAEARFVWRLVMLPEEAKTLVRQPELTRGEFAGVLYWLFPQIRYAQPTSGLIVNDVFEHPAREQIVRVVNLGLMSVDRALHRFEPERPVTRIEALTSFLMLLARAEPRPVCLGAYDAELGASVAGVCETVARCGLIDDAAECLPGGPLSGSAAARISRKTLELSGVE